MRERCWGGTADSGPGVNGLPPEQTSREGVHNTGHGHVGNYSSPNQALLAPGERLPPPSHHGTGAKHQPGWRREAVCRGDGEKGGYLCQPLPPPPSGISIASQAEAEEALESVESEAFSLIESHASVARKAPQSRKDLGATEPQTPPPSPAPRQSSCLSFALSLAHEHGLGGSWGKASEIPPCAPHLVRGHHTRYLVGPRILGDAHSASWSWSSSWGCSTLTGHLPNRDVSLQACTPSRSSSGSSPSSASVEMLHLLPCLAWLLHEPKHGPSGVQPPHLEVRSRSTAPRLHLHNRAERGPQDGVRGAHRVVISPSESMSIADGGGRFEESSSFRF